jgi:hypothetical protein
MKAFRSKCLTAVIACGAIGTLACAERDPIALDSTVAPDGLVAYNTSAAPPSATGSGHTLAGGAPRTFAFSAVSRADGSAAGNYEIVIHAIGAFFMVDVTCMRVLGNKAWVAGIIRKSNNPAVREGTVSYFWTIDGGEGPTAVDIVSTARINDPLGEDQRFCSLMPDEATSGLPGNVVLRGNVQVRGD